MKMDKMVPQEGREKSLRVVSSFSQLMEVSPCLLVDVAVMQINYLRKNNDRLQTNYNVLLQGCKDAASAHNSRTLAFEALKAENEVLKRQLRDSIPKPPTVALPPIPGPINGGGRSTNSGIVADHENIPKDETHRMADAEGETPSRASQVDVESIIVESTRKTITSVMGTFKEMMGLEPSSSEPGSDDELSTEDSASVYSISEHDEVQHDNLNLQTQHQNNESRLGKDAAGGSSDHAPRQSHTNPSQPQDGMLSAQESRKRIRNNSPTGEDDDGNQKRQRSGSAKKPNTEEPSKKYACPYHKRWPEIQPKHQSCVFPGFSNVSRVK